MFGRYCVFCLFSWVLFWFLCRVQRRRSADNHFMFTSSAHIVDSCGDGAYKSDILLQGVEVGAKALKSVLFRTEHGDDACK